MEGEVFRWPLPSTSASSLPIFFYLRRSSLSLIVRAFFLQPASLVLSFHFKT